MSTLLKILDLDEVSRVVGDTVKSFLVENFIDKDEPVAEPEQPVVVVDVIAEIHRVIGLMDEKKSLGHLNLEAYQVLKDALAVLESYDWSDE